jgi:D-alanyl-D-alanine carboxypeptidase
VEKNEKKMKPSREEALGKTTMETQMNQNTLLAAHKTPVRWIRRAMWTLIIWLTSTWAFAAEAVAPRILLDQQYGYPRLTWTNVLGHTYLIQTRERLDEGDWSPQVTLTVDSNMATWTDEAERSAMRFYRVGALVETNWASKLQKALDSARKSQGAKGVSAVVITTNGLWQGTSGLSDPRTTNSIQPQMHFDIASNTKMFVAALLLQLAEEGQLTLDDPISRWLPDYPNVTNTITLRQFLNHTSGVFDLFENPALWRQDIEMSYRSMLGDHTKHYTPAEALAYVKRPYFAPGKGWHYSNSGYILLGLIAEAVTQRLIASEIRARFLEPLQLRSPYLRIGEPATRELAHPFSDVDGVGGLDDMSALPTTGMYSLAWAAGGMFSTALDLARWVRALYGGAVLRPDSLAQMTQWVPYNTSPFPGYGLGTMRLSTTKGDFWGNGGLMPGYFSSSGHSPTRHITVVVLINQDHVNQGAIWLALINAL